MTPYIDSRIKDIEPVDRKVLLSFGRAFDIDDRVPQDVVIRAVRSMRITALLLLE
jgi:hypothetical protein